MFLMALGAEPVNERCQAVPPNISFNGAAALLFAQQSNGMNGCV